MILNDLYNKAKSFLNSPAPKSLQRIQSPQQVVQNYFKPVPGQVRTRDIVRELPSQFKPAQMAENLMNAPKFTIGQNSNSKLAQLGGGVANQLLNPFINVKDYAKEASGQYYGVRPANTQKLVGMGLGAALDLGGMVSGGQLANQFFRKGARAALPVGLSQTIKQGARQGASMGAKYGAGYGFAGGMTENQDPFEVIRQTLKGGAFGALTGGALGGGIPAIGGLTSSLKHDLGNRMSQKIRVNDTPTPNTIKSVPEMFKYGINNTSVPGFVDHVQSPLRTPDTLRGIRGAFPKSAGLSIQDITKGDNFDAAALLRGESKNSSRAITLPNGKKIFINGPEDALTGSTAKITRRGNKIIEAKLENQGKSEIPQIKGTPLLDSGKTAEQLLLGKGRGQLALPKGARQAPTKVIPSKEQINLPEESRYLNPETSKNEVVKNLGKKFDDFEKRLYGSATSELKGGTKGATKFQKIVRPLRESANRKFEQGLSSENGLVRNISRGIRGLMGSAGNTAERSAMQGKMKGGIDTSRSLANDFQKLGDEMLPDKLSREKVWAHLDPELAGVRVGAEHLTAQESKAVETLRQASDLINDQNYAMGRISHETWLKGRGGKYITRAYEDYDLPPELSEAFQKGSAKLDLGAYKQRGDVTEWKQENAIKDPFYLASKRVQSTFTNKALTDYGDWISTQKDKLSDVAKDGYTQLSDNPMWGKMANKYVRHDVLTDMKGFYSDNKALQGLYDALNAYDRFKPRQILKKTKTVYNPATRLGNQISNRVFAIFNGINPISFEKNFHTFAKTELKNNGKYARALRNSGVLGTDMTKYELVKNLAGQSKDEVGKLGKIDNYIADTYGRADDLAKLSAFKYWLDQGKTMEESVLKVKNGFQDYSKVGQFYDFGAKLPLVGKPFIRFQSELARIIKNSVLENPLRVPLVVGTIALMGEFGSKASGETAEDKKTRENRFGTPVVPFTNVPLVIQTPYGEVNIARMFGMYETTGADTTNKNPVQRISKYLPVDVPTSKEDALKMASNDPLTGGITSLITDTDFRGKSISDPDQSKYKMSNLTDSEKNVNRAKYLANNYNLPVLNDVLNVKNAIQGEPDFYGRTKTPAQAISKMAGFKVEQFGPQQVADTRIKDQQFAQYKKDEIRKNINSILKDQTQGKIDDDTAKKRIENQQKKLAPADQENGTELLGKTAKADTRIVKNPMGGYSYVDKDGDFRTVDSYKKADEAVTKMDFLESSDNILKKDGKVYRKNSSGDVQTMSEDQYNTQLQTAKLSKYKRNENLNDWLKTAEEKFTSLENQLEDPNIDELDKVKVQDDIDELVELYQKYKGYGGFTKPKKGKAPKKVKINFDADFKAPDIPKLSSPKINLSMPKVPQFKPIRLKQSRPQKIKINRISSTIPGAKRLA